MSKGKSDKVRYKPYEQGQQFLLLPVLEELVPAGHLARSVSEVTGGLNVEPMLPAGKLAALRSLELSEKEKRSPGVSGWYFRKSARHPVSGKKNAALTCQNFGTRRSRFYRRLARYGKTRLDSPEPSSMVPKRKREPDYNRALVAEARGIRKDNTTYSGKKILPILPQSRPEADVPRRRVWDGS